MSTAVVIEMQPDKYLTGRRRYRTEKDEHAIGYLILQVEKAVFTPGHGKVCGAWKCYWFDATPEDVSKEELA